jgi:hypothetical protein
MTRKTMPASNFHSSSPFGHEAVCAKAYTKFARWGGGVIPSSNYKFRLPRFLSGVVYAFPSINPLNVHAHIISNQYIIEDYAQKPADAANQQAPTLAETFPKHACGEYTKLLTPGAE